MSDIPQDIVDTVARILGDHDIDYDKALTGQDICEAIFAERSRFANAGVTVDDKGKISIAIPKNSMVFISSGAA